MSKIVRPTTREEYAATVEAYPTNNVGEYGPHPYVDTGRRGAGRGACGLPVCGRSKVEEIHRNPPAVYQRPANKERGPR